MLSKDAFQMLEKNILKKGCKVKMNSIKGFEEFTEIDDVFIKRARPLEMEDDYVVIVIDNQIYDSAWIDEVRN